MAMLSILALYNYTGNDLFSGFRVPEGMDRSTAMDNILLECAELSLVYTEPLFMQRAIKQWTDKEFKIWEKLYNTENLDYNPIWNVDAHISEIEATERDKTGNLDRRTSGNETGEGTGHVTSSSEASESTEADTDATTTKSVTGYNSANWQAHEKEVLDEDKDITTGRTASETTDERRSDLRTVSGNESVDDAENEEINRRLTTERTGNIGVTTTQQMIEQEREVAQFNTIDYITKSFKRRFCVQVY